MYEDMLKRIEEQLLMTKEILGVAKKCYRSAVKANSEPDIVRAQREIDFEQGYLKGVAACKAILESYYDRIA